MIESCRKGEHIASDCPLHHAQKEANEESVQGRPDDASLVHAEHEFRRAMREAFDAGAAEVRYLEEICVRSLVEESKYATISSLETRQQIRLEKTLTSSCDFSKAAPQLSLAPLLSSSPLAISGTGTASSQNHRITKNIDTKPKTALSHPGIVKKLNKFKITLLSLTGSGNPTKIKPIEGPIILAMVCAIR